MNTLNFRDLENPRAWKTVIRVLSLNHNKNKSESRSPIKLKEKSTRITGKNPIRGRVENPITNITKERGKRSFIFPIWGAWETNASVEETKMCCINIAGKVVSILACDSHFLNIAIQSGIMGVN